MKHIVAVVLVAGFSLAQLSCARPQTFDATEVKKSIEAENAKYSQAIREGNVTGALAAYTDDATALPPDGQMIRGKQAIEEMYKRFLQIGMKEVTLITLEVGGSGDVAYEIGKTKVRIQPEGQPSMTDSTKYLVIWKRQADGTWKVHVDIWNFSAPMAGK
jgi:uncharacterized protein (TIGR02246 family)